MIAAFEIDDILKIAVFFFLFVAPVIKGLLDSGKKKRERAAERKVFDAEREQELEEGDGKRAWEALLRGEEPVERPAPPAPPAPAATIARAAPRELEPAHHVERETYTPTFDNAFDRPAPAEGRVVLTEAPSLDSRSHAPSEPRLEATPSLEARSRSQDAALTEAPSSEGLPLADRVAAGEIVGLARTPDPSRAPAGARSAAMRLRSREDWRRAIVIAEVLAPPVSMRPWRGGSSYSDVA